jgi:hypothetical protein
MASGARKARAVCMRRQLATTLAACSEGYAGLSWATGGLLRGLCRALTCVTRGRLECIMLLHARRVGCGADSLVTSGADVGPSPGADVGAVSPVPVPMWQR